MHNQGLKMVGKNQKIGWASAVPGICGASLTGKAAQCSNGRNFEPLLGKMI